jgi:hypothetical protein
MTALDAYHALLSLPDPPELIGRGHRLIYGSPDRHRLNRMGAQRFQQIVDAQEKCTRAERLARKLTLVRSR